MKKLSQQEEQEIIECYNHGKTNISIGKEFGIPPDRVTTVLKKHGIKRESYMKRLSDEQKLEVCKLYQSNQFDRIFKLYPFLNRNRVYHIASTLNIKKPSYFWTSEEEQILISNYHKISSDDLYNRLNGRHSKKAIVTKAIKLGLTKPQEWTEEELQVLKDNYSLKTKEEMCKLIPTRTAASICLKAEQLGIKSYTYLQEKYTQEEKEFIRNNFGILSDKEIAEILHKTPCGISGQRCSMGLLYLKKDYSNYRGLQKFFRAHIYEWKSKTMELCNYQCILTGSKDFAIHHLHGFNSIFNEVCKILEDQNLLKSTNTSDYTKEELDNLLNIFASVHDKYPLGICIRKDIHDHFHKIYGQGGNTPEQWENYLENHYNKQFQPEN